MKKQDLIRWLILQMKSVKSQRTSRNDLVPNCAGSQLAWFSIMEVVFYKRGTNFSISGILSPLKIASQRFPGGSDEVIVSGEWTFKEHLLWKEIFPRRQTAERRWNREKPGRTAAKKEVFCSRLKCRLQGRDKLAMWLFKVNSLIQMQIIVSTPTGHKYSQTPHPICTIHNE